MQMDLKLFKHNKKAYKAAVCLMEEVGKAAIIHPTGTGKSMIAFQLAVDNPHKRIVWFSPSEYIFRTQLDNITKILSGQNYEIKNIIFLTYAKLMHNEAIIEVLCPDYIILDEFHRCGAVEWGKSITKLLNVYPNVKLLGLSATNIRYLDNPEPESGQWSFSKPRCHYRSL